MKCKFFVVFVSVLLLLSFAGVFVVSVSAYTGTITYDAGTDTVTCVGGTSGTPITCEDLRLADVAGGWSQVSKLGSYSFLVDARLQIGNGSTTYFQLGDRESLYVGGWVVKSGGHFYVGVATNRYGKYASMLVSDDTANNVQTAVESGGELVAYNSVIRDKKGDWCTLDFQKVTVVNCLIEGNSDGQYKKRYWTSYSSDSRYERVSFGGHDGFIVGAATDLNDVVFHDQTDGFVFFWAGSGDRYLRNARFEDVTYVGRIENSEPSIYLINPVVESWAFNWISSPDAVVYRQYEFDLYVLNGAVTDFVEDANVTLSHDGAVFGSWLANSSGQIPTQTLTYGFYNQTGGNDMYGGTAWNLTVTDHEWATYTSSFYPMAEIDWSISMQNRTVLSGNASEADVLSGHSFYNDSEVLRVGSASLTNHTITNYELSGDWVSIRNYVGLGAVVCVLGVMVVFVARKRR